MSLITLGFSFFSMKINNRRNRSSILAIQEKKFRKMLIYAYKNSKFYHDLYVKNNISEKDLNSIDIEKIPVINKDILMDNLDDILTVSDVTKKELLNFLEKSTDPCELFKGKYHVIHTSGSSGKLGIFVYSKKDWDSFLPYLTQAFNFKFKRKRSVFLGAAGGHFTGASTSAWTSQGITRFFCKPLVLDINEPLDVIIKKLNEFQPHILGGYFNGLKVLSDQQTKGNLKLKPEILVNCGEGINPKEKKDIERIFKASMTNLYGFAESPIVGTSLKGSDGIYLWDTISLLEFKDDHILLTNLYNKTQPIIRYRIDDYVKKIKNPDDKIPFTLIDNIVGRDEFVIWFENKDGKMDFIHPLIFTDFYVNGLDKHQIVIKDKKSFIFRAVINSKDKNQVINNIKIKLEKLLSDKNFSNVKFEIEVVKELRADDKTRKFKLIVKE
jgi:phenylacetate-CoA ligase